MADAHVPSSQGPLRRLPQSWLPWHGAGQAGHSVQGFLLGFLFIYYNQVLELSGTLTGIGLMLNKGQLLVFMAFLSAFAIAPVSVTVASMMGDMADEHELRKGTRQEGVYFAAFHFAEKGTGAIAPLLAGIAVDLVQLDPGAIPGEVPAQVLFDFGLIYAAMAVFVLLAIWAFWPYNLNRRRHAEIVAALARRKESEKTAGAVLEGQA